MTAHYLGAPGRPEVRAVLNFPLAWDLRAVFAKGAAPALLKYRLESMSRHYAGGRASVNFIDNHDMPRFLSEGGEEGLIQALAALFTIPGMPVVYAGTEVGFTETRASMFAKGFGPGQGPFRPGPSAWHHREARGAQARPEPPAAGILAPLLRSGLGPRPPGL